MRYGHKKLGARLRLALVLESPSVQGRRICCKASSRRRVGWSSAANGSSRELGELLRGRRLATVLVTHDLAETSALCDRCAVIDAGAILQHGRTQELLARPQTPRVAEILGLEGS